MTIKRFREITEVFSEIIATKAKGHQKAGGQHSEVGRQKSDKPLDTKKEFERKTTRQKSDKSFGKTVDTKKELAKIADVAALISFYQAFGICAIKQFGKSDFQIVYSQKAKSLNSRDA